nr:MAG TPA: Multiple myeloma tumor-associated [Caudoviricetes sp.]
MALWLGHSIMSPTIQSLVASRRNRAGIISRST